MLSISELAAECIALADTPVEFNKFDELRELLRWSFWLSCSFSVVVGVVVEVVEVVISERWFQRVAKLSP